jgi:ribosome-associated translation inhibitor RaiA
MALSFPNVEFLKFPEIDEVDGGILGKNFDHFFRKVPYQNEVKIHISHKEYAKGGMRVQHEIHAKLVVDGKQFFAKETGWKLLEVMQDVLKKLEKEVLREHEKK